MQVQDESKPYDSINITPMLDLAYVLLVIFILMTTASVSGMTLHMPKPSNKPSTEKHELSIVQIQNGNSITLNGAGVTINELEAQLNATRARDPKFSVVVKGQASANYAGVVAVIDLLTRMNIENVGLITGRLGT